MRTDLEPFRTFLAVCDAGSLSAAAERLGRTQSAVSMLIKRIEDDVGTPLLRRSARGVSLLQAGRLYRDYAQRILGLADEVRSRLTHTLPAGVLRIGLPEELATAALWSALGRFRRASNGTALQVLVGDTGVITRQWQQGLLDVGVTVVESSTRPWYQCVMELRWACAAGYQLDRLKPLDVVTFSEPCQWRRHMLDELARANADWRVSFESGSVSAVVGAVDAGLGATLLPRVMLERRAVRELSPKERPFGPIRIPYGMFVRARPTAVVGEAARLLRVEMERVSA